MKSGLLADLLALHEIRRKVVTIHLENLSLHKFTLRKVKYARWTLRKLKYAYQTLKISKPVHEGAKNKEQGT